MEILKSKEFLAEKTTFNLITLIMNSENPEYLTDNKTYLICRSSNITPIWIWTSNDISEEKQEEVLEKLDTLLDDDKVLQVTSKEIIFKKIVDKYQEKITRGYFKEKDYYLHMVTYKCENPVLTKPIIGKKERPTMDDLETLKLFKKHDYEDTLTEEYSSKVTDEHLLTKTLKHINDPNFYVWKVNERIVATASYVEEAEEARISCVFTNRDDRGNGYAGMLVYELCKEIIKKGKIPVIYADYDYLPSNKAYQKIGFKQVGDLYNVKIGNGDVNVIGR